MPSLGFAFAYVGLSMWSLRLTEVNTYFSIYLLSACLISRFATVFLVSGVTHALVSKQNSSFSLTFRDQFTLSLGGVVRGCLCWAQALQVHGQGPLISAILIIVISTTIGGGILLPILIHIPPPSEKEKRRPLYRRIMASAALERAGDCEGGGIFSLRSQPPPDRGFRQHLRLGGDPREEEEGAGGGGRDSGDETSSTGSVYSDVDDIDKFFLHTWEEGDAFQPVRSVSDFARSGVNLPTNSFSPRGFSVPYAPSPYAPSYSHSRSQRPPFSPAQASEESTYSTHLDRTVDDDETSNFSRTPSPTMSPHGVRGEAGGGPEADGGHDSGDARQYPLPTPTRRPRLPSSSSISHHHGISGTVVSPGRREHQQQQQQQQPEQSGGAAEHTSLYLAWSRFDERIMKPLFGGRQRSTHGQSSESGPGTRGSAGDWEVRPLSVDVRSAARGAPRIFPRPALEGPRVGIQEEGQTHPVSDSTGKGAGAGGTEAAESLLGVGLNIYRTVAGVGEGALLAFGKGKDKASYGGV